MSGYGGYHPLAMNTPQVAKVARSHTERHSIQNHMQRYRPYNR